MNHDQIQARNAKELETIKRKVAKLVKTLGCNTGDIVWGSANNEHWVQVENDGRIGDDYLGDIIRKSPTARIIRVEEHEGHYMWSANFYVRPVSTVTFKF